MKKLNKKILITGGAGYIGQNLISFFLKKKYRIYVIDNLSRSASLNNNIKKNINFYKILLKKNSNKIKSNYYVSLIINLFYFILTIPAILMMNNGVFCKYYSIIFFLIYLFSYKIVNERTK